MSAKRTTTETLVAALDVLARDIQSDDGVANAAIAEAAERLRELERELNQRDQACDDYARTIYAQAAEIENFKRHLPANDKLTQVVGNAAPKRHE